ncbi:serine/threonine-protein kinase ctr1 [Phtheirospermum japonicum]|uniref:non-specific serine/threonine protein kinase n=1 Tax=Phtheirospermum japonicum TaxID=374723 RepID=A0A830D6B8_9LAMI|nr:serine/threonine-protein kinase ctr1 [Phtheirospermum japonicum]
MSKMKHLLRKLHIGDHHQGRPPPPASLDPSPQTATSQPSTPSSSSPTQSADLPQTTTSAENESSNSNFNFLEEEFQMQLAMAISASDPGQTRVDSETAQIDAVKQISLGRSPSQSLAEFLSLRYWSCNVVNYDEKVIDGFYDICGIDSNLLVQTKMPSLLDLEEMSVLNNVGYEVLSVSRAVDMELRKLEERVYLMSMEHRALNGGLNTSFLVQKIADLIVARMGGPVSDVEEMFRRWKVRNHELRIHFNTVILPLGSLDVGHSRQRALLFKLVKGSYHTGTDEGAVNLIKLDSGSEYIIDLMGAPGTLIPAEAPSSLLQNFGLDTRTIAGIGNSSSKVPDQEVSMIKSKNEQSLFNNLLRNSSWKCSAEGLGGHQVILESAGYESSFDTQGKQSVLVKDRKDKLILNDDEALGSVLVDFSGNKEAMEIASNSQSNANKVHNMQDPVLDGVAEILWEDLQIGERIGIGSYGEVYRGEWNGTEVAVKKFMKQDISGDALEQFKCEIEIMLRLRHPNVVLLMGAVMQPPNMSILTEFLPRGSLYKLLHRPSIRIDEKRRIKMALDVAKGMNYLHSSHPVIVHRDLKTPNLLVDKNWVVKVCDFGMSRLQHNTFLSSKSAAGTAEWMAPEVLRNEQSNEKSDVYSFGVILWELATLRVPWSELNSMQVVGAVGFQGRHLDIPPMVEPLVADIITDCWNRNSQARPSFAQIITRLKSLQRLSTQRTDNRTNQL